MDKNNRPVPQIKYSKKINGTYYVVEAVFENDYNKLWVQSAYLKNDKEGVTQVPAESKNTNHVAYARSEFASSPSKNTLSQDGEKVNNDYISKGANSQGEGASFFDDNYEKTTPKLNPNEVVSGMWEDAPNSSKSIVEKSQLESVEKDTENGIIEETGVLTLDNLTRDVLKTKPPYSPRPKRWIEAGGSISIDSDGNWIYTDCDGITVKYVDGYPDFESAGTVNQKVNIGGFKNRASDSKMANTLAPNGPRKKGYVWHHSPDGQTMMEISEEIHKKFTHRGGYALMKMRRRK